MRTRDHRVARVRRALDCSPVRRDLLREAYGWFLDFGELPDDDDHVAYEVVQRALRRGEEEPPEEDAALAKRVRKAKLAYHEKDRPGDAWPPSVRAMLFDEALFERKPIRDLARWQIATEVSYGGDVESAGFGARHGIPMHGSITMHIAGYPKKWATPPYEQQATELFVRLDNIRERVPYRDDHWFEAQAKAIVAFKRTGELPRDELHFEAVLANVEIDQLIAHKEGKDVAEAMALFREVAWRDGEEQEKALRKLCEMARSGRLR